VIAYLFAQAHAHASEGFWSEVVELVSDPAHWAQEFVAEAVFFTLEVFLIDRLIHLHRRGRSLDAH